MAAGQEQLKSKKIEHTERVYLLLHSFYFVLLNNTKTKQLCDQHGKRLEKQKRKYSL